MAPPDLNSIVPPSNTATYGQQSHQAQPASSTTAHPTSGRTASTSSSRRQIQQLSAGSEQFPSMPRRHSRPMTPAELHAELEREQEGIVNRLTRELQSLRAHSSSIASTASAQSTASNPSSVTVNGFNAASTVPPVAQPATPALTAPVDPLAATNPTSALLMTAPSLSQPITSPRRPTPTRHHRSSSSSISSRTPSLTSSSPAFSLPASMTNSAAAPLGSQASFERARDAAGIHAPSPHFPSGFPPTRSRQGSMRSAQPSPSPAVATSPIEPGMRRPSMQLSSSRMEEAANARRNLEEAKAEREELISRVKELERELRSLGGVEYPRGRTAARYVSGS